MAMVLTIFTSLYVGFDRFYHSKSIFITVKNHHVGETFMLASYFFPWPRSALYFFHSRIATVMPVSHPLTRLIHISRVVGQFIVRLKLLSKWELSTELNFKSNVLYQGWPTRRSRSTGRSPSPSWSIAPNFALN